MRTKVQVRKGVNLVLTISMLGAGSSLYIPAAYAADNGNPPLQSVQDTSANLLSRLEIDGIQFDQSFSQLTSQYTATVENNIDNIHLLAGTDDNQITIMMNGKAVTNGEATPYQLQTGENIFIITVDDGKNTPNTYTVTVNRKQNNNNLLKSLLLSKGKLTPTFDSKVTEYQIHETNDVKSLMITAESAEKTSVVMVNNKLVTNNQISVPIPVGKSEITILVTAENGDKKTYTLEVNRDENKTPTYPTNSNGSGSTPNSSGSSKTQNSNKYGNGAGRSQGSTGSFGNVSWSGASQGTSQQNAAAVQKVSMATLGKVTVSNGTWNKTFSKDEFTYHVTEASDATSVTLSLNPSYSGATVAVQGGSNTIQLGDNKKTIVPIVVTKGSEHKTYVLVFDKDVKENVGTATTSDVVATSATTTTSTTTDRTPFSSNSWNGRNNTQSTSWWGRLINSIKSLFN
ncbi:MAG: cadherin-like beta sandwich domain-containing protein [Bacillota bacterium]|nr:cadherin-like beta sandwich domain-containing protein [Bacillota bacterium]